MDKWSDDKIKNSEFTLNVCGKYQLHNHDILDSQQEICEFYGSGYSSRWEDQYFE